MIATALFHTQLTRAFEDGTVGGGALIAALTGAVVRIVDGLDQ